MAFPLRTGKIASYSGFDEVAKYPGVIDLTRYYNEGDEIMPKHVNTLDQLFARIMVSAPDKSSLMKRLKAIRDKVSVKSDKGEEMIIWDTFDSIYNEFNKGKK